MTHLTHEPSPASELTQEHELFRNTVRRFVESEINPHVEQWEAARSFPAHELFPRMGELGLLGPSYPEEYGGAGVDYWYHVILAEELGRAGCAGVPMAILVQTDIGVSGLAEFGSHELKKKFLQPAIEGRMVACLGVSEPDAGSDVAAIRTRARTEGDEYVIHGSKMWITNGTQADFVVLLARTGEADGYRGMSLIVVPTDTPGFSVSRKLEKLGNHSSDTALLSFDGVRVPRSYCVGEEGKGFKYQMKQFQKERLLGSSMAASGTRRAVGMTVDYCRRRRAFGRPLLENQWIYFRLSELLTEIEMLHQFNHFCTRRLVAGQDVTREVSMAKLKSGRLAREVADTCLQFHGGMGYAEEYPMARYFRDARLLSIGAGADEVMLQIIARYEGIFPE
ncbi:MAG: acyl-CoA dehydrogenase family protein [Armatimonadetes bacterium]|nr:acyl-CoA dehydrogenase family protein [Armatimonadota bacterium]